MRKLLVSLALMIGLTASIPAWITGGMAGVGLAYAVDLNPLIEQFEKSTEAKLQEKIRILYGPDTKISVNVHAIPGVKAADAPKATPSPVPTRSLSLEDIGYAPFPVDASGIWQTGPKDNENNASVSPPAPAIPLLTIADVEVDVQASDDTDPSVIQDVSGLIRQTLKPFAPKVTVSKFKAPKKPAPKPSEAPKDASKDTSKDSSKDSGKDPAQKETTKEVQKPEWDWKSSLLPTLLGAIILAIGIYMLGKSIMAGATALADGIKINSANKGETTNKGGLNGKASLGAAGGKGADGAEDAEGEGSGLTQSSPGTALRDYARNLKLIRQILKDDALTFVKAIQDTDADWQGLRWLLPCLTLEEQDILRKCLGPERVARLSEVKGNSALPDPTIWLQQLVERIMLQKIRGGSTVEKALGPTRTVRLALAESAILLRAVKELNDRATWRIVSEFLPKKDMQKLLAETAEEQLKLVVTAADATNEELESAAGRIMQYIDGAPAEESREKDREQFYSNTLLEPIISSVASRELGQDDLLLDELETSAPQLVRMVRDKIWTPRQLDRVPDAYLAQMIKKCSNDQRTALIVTLPQEQSERVNRLLPEGNVRTIITDQVTKTREKNDPTARKTAVASVRQFLETLRKHSEERKFKLQESPKKAAEETGSTETSPENSNAARAA